MSTRTLRKANPEQVVTKLVTRAVRERDLIENGDRILIGVSGGKDSTTLAWALSAVRRAVKKDYEIAGIHITADFPNSYSSEIVSGQMHDWGIPFTEVEVPVLGRLKEGRTMNCYWCSTQRRTELIRHAMAHGYNKIALGHHMDDIIETFFMNLLNKGEMLTMPMRLVYRKFPLTLIRPLGYLEERQIIAFADSRGYLKTSCTCSWGDNSSRLDARRKIQALTQGSGDTKRRILQALAGGPADLLVDDETAGT
jgi:tRNA 2-thiocytidine biosynthesis protein TtcA